MIKIRNYRTTCLPTARRLSCVRLNGAEDDSLIFGLFFIADFAFDFSFFSGRTVAPSCFRWSCASSTVALLEAKDSILKRVRQVRTVKGPQLELWLQHDSTVETFSIMALSYVHSFHAGSCVDVLKHALLRQIIQLRALDKPFVYVDTHAGSGLYDLFSGQAQATREHDNGVSRYRHTAQCTLHTTPA